MKNERLFLKREICGNIVGMIENAGVTVKCCGKDMVALVPNTVDAAKEKHVPVAVREGNRMTVNVGAVDHPMTEEHHIAWIVIAQDKKTQRITLEHTGKPSAVFCVDDGSATIYEYCNLHGLWAVEA